MVSGFRKSWDKIRERELRRAEYGCEICKASEGVLECHEKWDYDEDTLTQRLIGYEVVCRDCDIVLHLGRVSCYGLLDKAEAHFVKVTGLTESDFKKVAEAAMEEWANRSKHTWHIDVSYEPLCKGFEEKVAGLELNLGQNKWRELLKQAIQHRKSDRTEQAMVYRLC